MVTDKTKRRSARIACCVILTALLVSFGYSQEQHESTSRPTVSEHQTIRCALTLSIDVFVVEVEVKSADGLHVASLGVDEFTVYEDGKEQPIRIFSDEQEPDVADPKVIYRLGYYPTPLRPGEEPRRIRIKVRKWKSRGYEVIYYPSWHLREYDP